MFLEKDIISRPLYSGIQTSRRAARTRTAVSILGKLQHGITVLSPQRQAILSLHLVPVANLDGLNTSVALLCYSTKVLCTYTDNTTVAIGHQPRFPRVPAMPGSAAAATSRAVDGPIGTDTGT